MTTISAFYLQEEGNEGNTLTTLAEIRDFIARVQKDSVEWECELLTQWYIKDAKDTPEFCVGIKGDKGVVTFSGRGWTGGIWVSIGDTSRREEPNVEYDYMGNLTEVPADGEISIDAVVRAAEEFFASNGDRPTTVEWRKYV